MTSPINKPKHWRKKTSLKTVEIHVKEWFDKVNGNSYFSACVIVNYARPNSFQFNIGFQYGYGNYGEQRALELLYEHGVTDCKRAYDLRQRNVGIKTFKTENCLKRDCKAFVGENFVY